MNGVIINSSYVSTASVTSISYNLHQHNNIYFTEAPSAPTAPLEISSLTPHSIMVEWGAPDSDGGAPLEGYKVAVRDAKRQMWMEVGRVASDVQRLQVKDLAVSSNNYTLWH